MTETLEDNLVCFQYTAILPQKFERKLETESQKIPVPANYKVPELITGEVLEIFPQFQCKHVNLVTSIRGKTFTTKSRAITLKSALELFSGGNWNQI